LSIQPATLDEGGQGLEVGRSVVEGLGYNGASSVAGGPGVSLCQTSLDRRDHFPEPGSLAFPFNLAYQTDVILFYSVLAGDSLIT